MKPLAILLAALLLVAAGVPAAESADNPPGIAFAQAEEGTWWCRDADLGKAVACALRKCSGEAGGQECHQTRWCMPAGWSGLMVGWLPEFHSTLALCGLPDQASVAAALKAVCDTAPEFSRCDLVLVIDPEGTEQRISDTTWPGASTDGGETAPEAPAPQQVQ